jgi:hypothetical protein
VVASVIVAEIQGRRGGRRGQAAWYGRPQRERQPASRQPVCCQQSSAWTVALQRDSRLPDPDGKTIVAQVWRPMKIKWVRLGGPHSPRLPAFAPEFQEFSAATGKEIRVL